MNNLSFGKGRYVLKDSLFARIYRIMKLTTALLLIFLTCAYGKGNAQKITLSLQNAKLEDAFKEISKQTNYRFFYSDALVKSADRISISVKNEDLRTALTKLLASNKMIFKVIDETISVTAKEEKPPVAAKPIEAQQNQVKGVIRGSNNEPLMGATILVKGTSVGATTNEQGEFTINAPANATLLIRFMGYNSKEVEVSGRSLINVQLSAIDNKLEEVNIVATGYQNLDRKLFTGASTKVNAKDAERNGVPDVSRMLEGQVAGVSVQNVSGTFGAAPKVRVRGATSLSGDNKPLWVVDGIILEDIVNISNEALSTGDANTLIGSSVAGLNPDDIESFTILKDAAATALYGARAMNGVVVITTKKGRNTDGKALVNYSTNFTSYIKPTYSQFDIMNSADQMSVLIEMENKGFFQHPTSSAAATGGIFYKMYEDMYDYNKETDSYTLKNGLNQQDRYDYLAKYAEANTDWFDALFKNSLMQDHSVSVSGGSSRYQGYFSTSFLHDNGQTDADKVKRYTANLRNNFQLNDKLSFELLANASIRDQRAPGTMSRESDPVYGTYSRDFDINPYSYALNASRLLRPYDDEGNREFYVMNWAPFNIFNELDKNYINLTMMDIKIQGGVRYKIIPGLQYSIDGAYRYAQTTRQHHILEGANQVESFRAYGNTFVIENNPWLYRDPELGNEFPKVVLPAGGFFNTNEDKILNYYLRNNLEYDKTWGTHRLNLFGSLETRYTDRQYYHYDGAGYQYENGGLVDANYLYFKKVNESGDPYFGMGYNYDRYLAYAFRGAYNFADKYSLNATLRFDGSNKLGSSKQARWLPTWNLSAAWDLDQEKFFNQDGIWSSARIRGTYGLVASLGNATNTSATFYNRISRRPYEIERETQTYLNALQNSELTWEKMYELNLGTDLSFFDNRINLTFDWYKRNMFDGLSYIRTSGIGGEASKYANNVTMSASGLEFTLAGLVIPGQDPTDFKWKTQLNFAINNNEITDLKVNPDLWTLVRAEGGTLVGGPQRGLYSIKFDGLDPNYGFPTFINERGVKDNYIYLSTTNVSQLHYHGPVDPKLTGGFFNRFDYKGFSLSSLFTFASGNHVRLQPTFARSYSDINALSNEMLNRWIMPGDELITNTPSILDLYTGENKYVQLSTGTKISPSTAYNMFNYSDQRVAKGDFIRLKTVSLAYVVPNNLIKGIGINSLQISLVGNNLALLYSDKKLRGADPEFFNNGGVAMPIPKQYTISLKAGF